VSTIIGYDTFVDVRFKKDLSGNQETLPLLHAAVGMAGEAGEFLDEVKKLWIYGKPTDLQKLVKEMGDLEFYMQAARNHLGITREEVIQANREKLIARYPTGYTDADAIARKDVA